MYDLMQLNSTTTMSSKEIAGITNKDHSHVIRDIREMLSQIDDPNMDHIDFKEFFDNRGYTSEIQLNKDLTLTLVAGYSSKIRYAVIKRWQELEQQAVKPVTPAIPQSFAEALQLAADQAKQLELAAPKVNAYDKLIDSTHLKTVGDVAKSIGLKSAQALNDKLDTVKAYDGRCADRVWSGWFVEQGLGRMITTPDGYSSNKMTAKGQAWALDLFGSE